VYVVVHVAVAPVPESVHGVGLKLPLVGEEEKPTVPVGVVGVPTVVSVTVAVQVVPTPTSTEVGKQAIEVVVVSTTVSPVVPLLAPKLFATPG
jgi:hypothetical protein